MEVSFHAPAALPPRKRELSTIGSWVGPNALENKFLPATAGNRTMVYNEKLTTVT
jgi:hypothetical protein